MSGSDSWSAPAACSACSEPAGFDNRGVSSFLDAFASTHVNRSVSRRLVPHSIVLALVVLCVLLGPKCGSAVLAQSDAAAEVPGAVGDPVAEQIQLPEPEAVRPPEPAMPLGMNPQQMLSPQGLTPTLKIMILLTLLSLAPSIMIMTTCFIRFVIVFSLLRQALGTQQLPPDQVISALSLFLTMFIMLPVWQQAYDDGIAPYVEQRPIPNLQAGEDVQKRVFINTFDPLRRFMSHQIRKANGDDVVWMLIDYRRPNPDSLAGRTWKAPESLDEVDGSIIVTAYMLTELKTAFTIGFQIFLPFLIIDIVVATILTGMGMMMLPPTLISLPFKVLLFVLIDGWTITVEMLLRSVSAAVN